MRYEKLRKRLEHLIDLGEKVLSTRRSPSPGVISDDYVNEELFYHWKVGALSFLQNVFGEDSIHFKEFHESCKHPHYLQALQGVSVLKAAKQDIEGGYLTRIETLVSADIFNNFLEMAEYLLEQGYKDPAASLIGAVLENGLRKIAKKHGIKLKTKETISSLNQKLADAQIYNRLTQKRIQVWNEVRDNADHGNFAEYSKKLVKEMLNGVRNFLEEHL